ncbi:recombinase family protein [Clostridium chromiireducens]|uniref:Recombinase family protein n=1 Tax=Clostridium chromiireducens TaxID=225345 RepID=A0A964RSL3_9CLOT|nr:recombinase family protein [Clostridium chromiireducens]MVX67099.1 recombinase family protein [Clostridium chromiireducens]
MNVAIYSRKSKFTGKGESIENQVQMCKDYLLSQNRNDETYEFWVYEDEGFSGGNTNRPEFQRLMNDAALKKFSMLICYRLDRISRNVADFSSTLETLQRYDIDFVSIREQFDTSSPMGRAMIYIASVFAQLERETIAERVRDNMLELAKSGRWLGGTPPLGYKSTPVTYYDENMTEHSMARLSIDAEELEIVKLIYSKYLELKSLSALETYLLENYYKTRNGYNFRKSTLKSILTNPVYAKSSEAIFDYLISQGMTLCGEPDNIHGLLTYNKLKTLYSKEGNHSREFRNPSDWIVAVSKHEGIIDSDNWLKIQKIYSGNSDKFIVSARSHNALLTGILKCEKCGSPMRIMHGPVSKKSGTKLYYYACTLKKDSKGSRCENPNGKVDQIDPIIINAIKDLGKNKEAFIKDLIDKNRQIKKEAVKGNLENNLNILIKQKKDQIDNLLNQLSLAPDLKDIIIPKIKVLKDELELLSKDFNESNNKIEEITIEELSLSFIKSLLEKCSIIDALTHDEIKELIRGLTKSITWDGMTYDLKINFIGSK